MKKSAPEAGCAEILRAVGDATRLGVLQVLLERPAHVNELALRLKVEQSLLSHHLKVLREAGWIRGDRRGTWIWYSLRPEAVERFRTLASMIEPAGTAVRGILGSRRLPVLDVAVPAS